VAVLLLRRGGEIHAIANTCAHLGGPLCEGKLEGDVVECPWHGSRFSLHDGQVVDGPATQPQPLFETRVREGWVEVRAVNA
jgi:nitrite reductase/ring-hydroxylating ferredoxin subunit